MMDKISTNKTQYVFTLNPNSKNVSNLVQGQYLLRQIKAKNILDICLIKKDSFDIDFKFSYFATVFCVLVRGLSGMYRNSVPYRTEWRTIKSSINNRSNYHSRKHYSKNDISCKIGEDNIIISKIEVTPTLILGENSIYNDVNVIKNRNGDTRGRTNNDTENDQIKIKIKMNDKLNEKKQLVEISSKEVCQCILSFLTDNGQISCTSWKIENSKVFIRKIKDLKLLKKILNNALVNFVRSIQLFWRYYAIRKRKQIILINDKIKFQLILCQNKDILKNKSALKIQTLFRGTKTREVRTKYFYDGCGVRIFKF